MMVVCIQGRWNIIELNFIKMDFESLADIISLMELVTSALENTGQIIKQVTIH